MSALFGCTILGWAVAARAEPDPAPVPAPEASPTPAAAPTPAPAPAADSGEPPWWVGLPLAQVRLEAPNGGLPDQTLEPLLHVEEGKPLDPVNIARDLTTLFQVGEFSDVRAEVEPWVTLDDAGEPTRAALLAYVVAPAPKIARVRFQGDRHFHDRDLLEASRLIEGQVYYADLDGPFVGDAIERWMRQQGYVGGRVRVRSTEPVPGHIYVLVEVDEGHPNTLESLAFTGDIDGVVTDAQLRRWVRKEGVSVGEPLAPDAVAKGQDAIRKQLGSVERNLFRRGRGYINARVTAPLDPSSEHTRVVYAIEPGARLELAVSGLGLNGRRKVEAALGIDHRLRITRGFLDQAPDRLEAALQERGWLTAQATVRLEQPDETLQRLVVDVDLGPKHVIGDVPDVFKFVDFTFDVVDPEPLARERKREDKELQAVFDQASPDILRRDFYTVEAMDIGLEAARQYFVDRGFLDAKLEVEPPDIERRRSLANLWRGAAGLDPHMRITPKVRVERGSVTMLAALGVVGAAPEVDLDAFEAERVGRIGHPLSPQGLDVLARSVVDAHRKAGYLAADARVQQSELGPQARAATIVVEPGERVLLRSVVVRGMRVTDASFVRNVVDLHPGNPVTSDDLDRVRSSLYDLGVFQSVRLNLLGDEAARDLLVNLDERKRLSFELAPGVSTDQGVRAYGRAVGRNLFGRAQQIELLGQVGFEFRSDDVRDWLLDVSNPEWRAAAQYSAPRFPGRQQQLVLDVVLRERRQERTWQMNESGGGVAIERHVRRPHVDGVGYDDLRLRLGARLETRQITEIDGGALLPGEPWAQIIGLRASTLPSPWRVQEALTGLAVYDLRDDPVQPHKGALLSLNAEWTPGLPWDELFDQPRTAFLKSDVRVSGYVPLSRFTLHLAVGGGYIASFAGLPPLEDRFRLGGTGSLRGYVRDSVGPQRKSLPLDVDWPGGIGPVIGHALADAPERWTPTGGDTLGTLTTELLMPLPALGLTGWDGYATEVFADVGNVWLLDPDATAISDQEPYASLVPFLRVGAGVGLQVETPVGPLQLDVALNPQAAFSQGARRALLVDAWREPSVRAHLTLGALW